MNTYRAVELPGGCWDIHWYADGESAGLMGERFQSEGAALFAVYQLARAEAQASRRNVGQG